MSKGTKIQVVDHTFSRDLFEAALRNQLLLAENGREALMNDTVNAGPDRFLDAQSGEIDLQDRLSSSIAELRSIAAATPVISTGGVHP